MTLAEFLERHHITRATFAKRIGVHPATVGRWVEGKTEPNVDGIGRIVRGTKGAVSANDIVGIKHNSKTSAA